MFFKIIFRFFFSPLFPNPVPKASVNGKQAEGVRKFQKFWLDKIPCNSLSKPMMEILISRRGYMFEAGKIYCLDKNFCKGSNRKQTKNKKSKFTKKIKQKALVEIVNKGPKL